MQKGFVHIYTGDGKGKTTAAVGLAIRAIGQGLKVLFIQFIKSSPTGELEILKKFNENIDIYRCSTGFIYEHPNENQKQIMKKCVSEIKEKILKNKYDLIVLDEFCNAINLGLISKKDAEELFQLKPFNAEFIITGRDAPEWLIEKADLVTEMKKIKHYFDKGIKARKGIEF